MNILLVGGGGREHAIVRKLRENPKVRTIWALPGNPGYGMDADCIDISAEDLDGVCEFARENPVDYAVVSPDDPLVMGLVDRLEALGIPCFGPHKAAAEIEGSKAFSKGLMEKYGIPTAKFKVFDDLDRALAFIDQVGAPLVVKASGLAKGKGVMICPTEDQAREAVRACMVEGKFGKSGETCLIEEFLEGPEVTVLTFTDGKTLVPMVSSMDHKRALDGDKGLNTGGMGCIAPNPYYTDEVAKTCMETIFLPTVEAMNKEGRPFKGCLYFGLMLTKDGPKVIEYNCRFGDPETQVVLPLLESDLLTIMEAVTEERLDQVEVNFSKDAACCVVLASEGYPQAYQTGYPVTVSEEVLDKVHFAGVRLERESLLTSGGRVLTVTDRAKTLDQAIKKAYRSIQDCHFDHAYYRKDIGQEALKARLS